MGKNRKTRKPNANGSRYRGIPSKAPGAGRKRRIDADKTTQITFWVDERWPVRADHLAKILSTKDMPLSRTDALRAALAAGFEALEARGMTTKAREIRAAPAEAQPPSA